MMTGHGKQRQTTYNVYSLYYTNHPSFSSATYDIAVTLLTALYMQLAESAQCSQHGRVVKIIAAVS